MSKDQEKSVTADELLLAHTYQMETFMRLLEKIANHENSSLANTFNVLALTVVDSLLDLYRSNADIRISYQIHVMTHRMILVQVISSDDLTSRSYARTIAIHDSLGILNFLSDALDSVDLFQIRSSVQLKQKSLPIEYDPPFIFDFATTSFTWFVDSTGIRLTFAPGELALVDQGRLDVFVPRMRLSRSVDTLLLLMN